MPLQECTFPYVSAPGRVPRAQAPPHVTRASVPGVPCTHPDSREDGRAPYLTGRRLPGVRRGERVREQRPEGHDGHQTVGDDLRVRLEPEQLPPVQGQREGTEHGEEDDAGDVE